MSPERPYQTSDGYLWPRTAAGLIRFDGVRFVQVDAVVGKELLKAISIMIAEMIADRSVDTFLT
jgi:ligand-binding sensor domain-containing protein